MTPHQAIERAVTLLGGTPSTMAAAMGGKIKRQHVEYWISCGRVPSEHSPQVERLTDGAVPCELLRPDLLWHRVKDKAWPWHRSGRPTLDVARMEAA